MSELITRYQNDRQNFDAKGYSDYIPLISPAIAITQAANKDQKIYILLDLGFCLVDSYWLIRWSDK